MNERSRPLATDGNPSKAHSEHRDSPTGQKKTPGGLTNRYARRNAEARERPTRQQIDRFAVVRMQLQAGRDEARERQRVAIERRGEATA